MAVVSSLKEILSIKIKTRHDSLSDQFSRLFMTKMLLIASFIMGFDYFSDKVSCMSHRDSHLSDDFIHSACWISGFYVYKEMYDRLEESSYYGIPQVIEHNGINDLNELCYIQNQYMPARKSCRPMTKVYYLQYQWLPFYTGVLSLLYYLPYIVFRAVNTDLISLRNAVDDTSCEADRLVKNFFNYKVNPIFRLRFRVFLTLGVKFLYIAASMFALYFTDYLLLGNFVDYGTNYLRWAKLNQTDAHDYTKNRVKPKPGNVVLPSMGFCEISEAFKGTLIQFQNQNVFICEISTNVLYQYVLIVLWFLIVGSATISILGVLSYVGEHAYRMCFCFGFGPKSTIRRYMTLRENEYLSFIKNKNMVMYGEVLRKLRQQRIDLHGKVTDGFETSNGFV